jgi:GT2 family glycosyltransferase
MTPKVSIILLNYNSFVDTNDCLDSLAKCTYANFDVWIVDNASSDDSIQKLQNNYSQHHYIHSKENKGFSGGCNVGSKAALENGAEYLLMLNNDTEVDPDLLSHLVDVAEAKENVGLVGGKSYFYSDKNVFWDAGGIINLRSGNGKRIGHFEEDKGQYDTERKVEFVTGCLMLIPEKVATEVGLLPECYFFGVEEWDYGCMVRKAGFDLWFAPKAKIWHKVGGAHSDVDPVYYYNFIRSRLLFMRRNASKAAYLLFFVKFYLHSRYYKLIKHKDILKETNSLKVATKMAFDDHSENAIISKSHLDYLRSVLA